MAISSSTMYPLHVPTTSTSLHVYFNKLRQGPARTGRSETMKAFSIYNGGSYNMRLIKGIGAGTVLEQPSSSTVADPSQFGALPLVEAGGDIGRSTERRGTGSGDSYKVLLVDDPRHTEKLVEKALPQIVPSISPDKARLLFYESRERGVAIVIVTVKEHAEFYAQMMLQRGLRSAIEPASSMEV